MRIERETMERYTVTLSPQQWDTLKALMRHVLAEPVRGFHGLAAEVTELAARRGL